MYVACDLCSIILIMMQKTDFSLLKESLYFFNASVMATLQLMISCGY